MSDKKESKIEQVIEAEEEILDPAVSSTEGAPLEEAVKEETVAENEDGFTDEVDVSEVYGSKEEAKGGEEAPKEPEAPAIAIYKEEEAPVEGEEAAKEEETGKEEATGLLENEVGLQAIEASRQTFYRFYKKMNWIKWIVTGVVLVIILVCWLVPQFIQVGVNAEGEPIGLDSGVTLGIGLGGIGLGLVVLLVYNILFKKAVEKETRNYFLSYYKGTDDYVFGGIAAERSGDVDAKLNDDEFNAGGLYKDVAKVGSRDRIEFKYKNHDVVFSDAAAQIKGQKSLQTVFVGKYMALDNAYGGNDLLVYLKGNKRALPPTTLEGRNLIENTKTMLVYGEHDGKRLFNKEVRNAVAKISTDATLVDLSIVIKAGKTYFYFGYEDNLMILPLEKPFDPRPTAHFKSDIENVFALVDTIDRSIERLN